MQLYSYTFGSTLFFPSVIPSWVNSCAIRQDYLAIISAVSQWNQYTPPYI